MKTVNVHEAKTELSKLLAAVEAGEDVVIARRNKPAVRLVPVAGKSLETEREGSLGAAKVQPPGTSKPRVPGRFAHMRGNLPPGLFAEPLTDEELAGWEGKGPDPSKP